jgi:hypothetical protein
MITLVQSHLHNDSQFTSTLVYQYLNQAQRRIVKDCPWGLGVKQGTITTASGTREYSLPADFYQLVSMWETTNSRRLAGMSRSRWVDFVEARSTIPEGVPCAYCLFGWDATTGRRRVRLYPTPGGIYTVKVFYYWYPDDISESNDGPFLTEGWDELLLWATLMIAREHIDVRGHDQALRNYRNRLIEYRNHRPESPDYEAGLRDQGGGRQGSSLRLSDHFPS